MEQVGFVRHPTSGERYAVRMLEGEIVDATGPCTYYDEGPAEDWLANAESWEKSEDAVWLRQELADLPLELFSR